MKRPLVVTVLSPSGEKVPDINTFGPFSTEAERDRWVDSVQRENLFGDRAHFLLCPILEPPAARTEPLISQAVANPLRIVVNEQEQTG